MKTRALLIIALACLAPAVARAAFEKWTSTDGRTAELELVAVTEKDGTLVGEFHLKNGRTTHISAKDLSDADSRRLEDFQAAAYAAAQPPPPPPVFEKYLEGALSQLADDKVQPYKSKDKPTKYYVFYYSASWCGPCHQFTPSLVEFYNKNKSAEFQIYLISSDRSDDDLEKYIKELKQPWPFLKVAKTPAFKKEFNHGIKGIPSLVICDPQGKVIKNSYDDKGEYIGAGAVMEELGKLLGK